MFEARLGIIARRKPRLIFDRRWEAAMDMEVGDRGQIVADVEVSRVSLETDSEGNEMKVVEFTVVTAEKVIKFDKRFV